MNKRGLLKKVLRYSNKWSEDGAYQISLLGLSVANFRYFEDRIDLCIQSGNKRLFSIPNPFRSACNTSVSRSFTQQEKELIASILSLRNHRIDRGSDKKYRKTQII